MPPRTRKSTEPATPPPADTSTAPETPSAAAEEEATQADPIADTPGETAPPLEQPGQAATPVITYHWESVTGDGSAPCRACPPGGPPPGTGSYGCPHGQWVRVQDAD